MKQITKAMLLLAGATLLAAGCNRQDMDGVFSRKHGQEVVFGAASHNGIKTRTEYKDYDQFDEQGRPTHQQIIWKQNDQIRVYSPTAARRVEVEKGLDESEWHHWADYQIVPDENDATKATIENLTNDGNGLAWVRGKESAEHTFYAIYPLNGNVVGDAEGTGTDLAGCRGDFQNLQILTPQSFSEKGNLDAYGYMTAMGKGKASGNGKVNLDFYPAFTTFEISVRSAGEAIGMKEFRLISKAEDLNGNFSVKVNDTEGNNSYTFASEEVEGAKVITINLTGYSAPKAEENKDLVFSVLALPRDFSKLRVEFESTANVTRALDLTYAATATGEGITPGGFVPFAGGRKHRIYGLAIPNGELLIQIGTAPWIEGFGSEYKYTTIENVTNRFTEVRRWDDDKDFSSWDIPGTYIAIAPGISDELVNTAGEGEPENLQPSKRPLYSTPLTLETVSVGVPLRLRSNNYPAIGFVTRGDDGIYSDPVEYIDIRASRGDLTDEQGNLIDDVVTTTYYVVTTVDAGSLGSDSAAWPTADITLVRMDPDNEGAPIAYSHEELPGSYDHTHVPFKVIPASYYENDSWTKSITPKKH